MHLSSAAVRAGDVKAAGLFAGASCLLALFCTALADSTSGVVHPWLTTALGTVLLVRFSPPLAPPAMLGGWYAGTAIASRLMAPPLGGGLVDPMIQVATMAGVWAVCRSRRWLRDGSDSMVALLGISGTYAVVSLAASLAAAVLATGTGTEVEYVELARRRWLSELTGMLFALPLALFSTRRQWAALLERGAMARSTALLGLTLAVSYWAIAGQRFPYIFVVVVLVIAALFAPALATATSVTAAVLLLVDASDDLGSGRDYAFELLPASLVVIAPIFVAALLADRARVEHRFHEAVEAAPTGMLIVDQDGIVSMANCRRRSASSATGAPSSADFRSRRCCPSA